MDTTLVIMFAAVIVMTSALSFMELRRIRKAIEGKQPSASQKTAVENAR
jgi:hypothetical protein